MHSRSVVAVVSLALLCGVAGPGGWAGLAAQGHGQDSRPGLAVLPFDNGGSYGQDKENFDALQKGIAGISGRAVPRFAVRRRDFPLTRLG